MNAKKFISIILVLISLILLFVPWINCETTVKKELISVIDELDTTVDTIESYQSQLDDEGIDLDLKKLRKAVHNVTGSLIDLKISPLEMFKISRVIIGNGNNVKKIVSSLGYPIGDKSNIINSLATLNRIIFFAWIYFVLVVFILVSGIYSLFKRIKNKKSRVQAVYFVLLLILLIIFGILTSTVNGAYQDSGMAELIPFSLKLQFIAFLAVIMAFPLRIKTATVGENINLGNIKTTIFSSLNKVASTVSNMTTNSDDVQVSNSEKILPKSLGFGNNSWICPGCGNRNKDEYQYCSRCGTAKPQKPKCKHCGKEIEENFVFCVYCGERIERDKSTEQSFESVSTKYCKYCGAKIATTSAFCPSCGEKLQ